MTRRTVCNFDGTGRLTSFESIYTTPFGESRSELHVITGKVFGVDSFAASFNKTIKWNCDDKGHLLSIERVDDIGEQKEVFGAYDSETNTAHVETTTSRAIDVAVYTKLMPLLKQADAATDASSIAAVQMRVNELQKWTHSIQCREVRSVFHEGLKVCNAKLDEARLRVLIARKIVASVPDLPPTEITAEQLAGAKDYILDKEQT